MDEAPEGIVWVKDDCPRCAAAKRHPFNRRVKCRPIGLVLSGQDPHWVDVMAQLAGQDYELPVVLLDGAFVEPEKLLPNACSLGASECGLTPDNSAAYAAESSVRKE